MPEPTLPITFSFDGNNPAAQKAAEKRAAQTVSGVTQETRNSIKAVIVRSIREGIPPYDAANLIVDMIGLNDRQAQAAMNYRDSLIDSGLNISKVDDLVEEYTDDKLEERAEMIARTEIMDALNEGALESWEQAAEDGLLDESFRVEWLTTPDEKTCGVCDDMDGEQIALGEMFEVDGEEMDGPPAHPSCRCTVMPVTE